MQVLCGFRSNQCTPAAVPCAGGFVRAVLSGLRPCLLTIAPPATTSPAPVPTQARRDSALMFSLQGYIRQTRRQGLSIWASLRIMTVSMIPRTRDDFETRGVASAAIKGREACLTRDSCDRNIIYRHSSIIRYITSNRLYCARREMVVAGTALKDTDVQYPAILKQILLLLRYPLYKSSYLGKAGTTDFRRAPQERSTVRGGVAHHNRYCLSPLLLCGSCRTASVYDTRTDELGGTAVGQQSGGLVFLLEGSLL